MMTLDQFIETRRDERVFPRNAYVKEPGFKDLYVRFNRRFVDGEVHNPVLDIANAEAKSPGSGAATTLVARLRAQYPEMGLFAENVSNTRFCSKLKAMGFKQLGSYVAAPSFWLPPDRRIKETLE